MQGVGGAGTDVDDGKVDGTRIRGPAREESGRSWVVPCSASSNYETSRIASKGRRHLPLGPEFFASDQFPRFTSFNHLNVLLRTFL